jgi:hypothetical protein
MCVILVLIVCFMVCLSVPVAAKAAQENDLSLFEFTEEVTTTSMNHLLTYPPSATPYLNREVVCHLHRALVLVSV